MMVYETSGPSKQSHDYGEDFQVSGHRQGPMSVPGAATQEGPPLPEEVEGGYPFLVLQGWIAAGKH